MAAERDTPDDNYRWELWTQTFQVGANGDRLALRRDGNVIAEFTRADGQPTLLSGAWPDDREEIESTLRRHRCLEP